MFVHVSANLANLEEVLKINRVVGGGGVMFFLPCFAGCFMKRGGGGQEKFTYNIKGASKKCKGKI